MEMCLKEVVDIRVPRRDNNNRLMGPSIIKLDFEKDTIDSHIIIIREII